MRTGEIIRKIRKEQKQTQKDFAKILGISPSYLSELENGKRNLNISTIDKLANKMGVSSLYLMTGTDDDNYLKKTKDGMINAENLIIATKEHRLNNLLSQNLLNSLDNELKEIYNEFLIFLNLYTFFMMYPPKNEADKKEADSDGEILNLIRGLVTIFAMLKNNNRSDEEKVLLYEAIEEICTKLSQKKF